MRSSTLPPKPPMRNFRPLMSASDLIFLAEPAAHLGAGVAHREVDDVVAGVELAHQLQAVAFEHPGRHLAAVQAEGDGAVQREGLVLAEEVVRRGVAHLDGAVLHAVDDAEGRHQFAGRRAPRSGTCRRSCP
jgi:hypothetical protein